MKKQIKFNIWNFIDKDDVYDILNDYLLDEAIFGRITSDIKHKILSIDNQGNILIESDFAFKHLTNA